MFRQRSPLPAPADKELESRIANYLLDRNLSRPGQLEIEAAGGTVTIRGRVRTFYQRQLYVHHCGRVDGVCRLVDEIEVDGAA